jgi:predicted glycogen debranching enzyme
MGPRLVEAPSERQTTIRAVQPDAVTLGRDICCELPAAESREWLVTNGIGGFASGTISGLATRRYHGLLVAALRPPLGRTLMVSHLEESLEYDGEKFALGTSRWAGGVVGPAGFRNIESFRLEGTMPVWTFTCRDVLIEKRVWMAQGENTTYVSYRLARGCRAVSLELKALVNYRDYHASTHAGDWKMRVEADERGVNVTAFEGAATLYLGCEGADTSLHTETEHDWYRNFDLSAERYRGLDDREDHLHAATFRAKLEPGKMFTFVASTEAAAKKAKAALREWKDREEELLERFVHTNRGTAEDAPARIRQLVFAADQFVAKRPLEDEPNGKTLIAGYHWFGDWGRDTMVALPGITLTTGRPEIAAQILRTFARFVDGGMLPNVFPDAGSAPEYNTVDAALWYFEAVRHYVVATNDLELLRELYPVLVEMVDAHLRGTRYQIHADPEDGLLYAGEAGVQLTWMDARVDAREVTPRIGKPVEINALWLNAVSSMTEFARLLGRPTAGHACLVKRARKGFARFWNESAQFCFDVIDGPDGNDATIRPNQILAVSLPECALSPEQQRAVVDRCGRDLLTSFGLRSLSPADPRYQGHYGGSSAERDGAYHQGTVWAWLLGPFALAHLRVHNDPEQAAGILAPLAHHLTTHGVGSVSEIFDGDAPFTPRGCIAQAWSVAETLRAWTLIEKARRGGTNHFARACNG